MAFITYNISNNITNDIAKNITNSIANKLTKSFANYFTTIVYHSDFEYITEEKLEHLAMTSLTHKETT